MIIVGHVPRVNIVGLFHSKEQDQDEAARRHDDSATKLDFAKHGVEEVVDAIKGVPSHLRQDISHFPKGSITLGYDPSLSKEENEAEYTHEISHHKLRFGGRLRNMIIGKYPDETVYTGEAPSTR